MKFADTGLPKHPAIEKAFAELSRLDKADDYTTRGVLIARLIADHGVHKDPEAIAAGLLIPLAQDQGPFLFARADLPGRVPDIIQCVFAFGAATMRGGETDQLYKDLDPAVRSVVLASSVRMFEVTADDLATSLAARRSGPPNAIEENDDLKHMIAPIKHFTDMVGRVEKDELPLVARCRQQMQRITAALEGADIKLPPAAPGAPKP
jgi:hypothetical protein